MPKQDSGWARRDDVHQQMADMMFGHCVSQTIRAVADISLADHLADGPLTAAEVAEREDSASGTTFRLMRASVALGLLSSDGDGRFHATPLLDTLRKDAPQSLRGLALAITNRAHWLPWDEFVASVRTGQSRAPKAVGMPIFDYLAQHPAQAEEFSAGMNSITSLWALDVVKMIDTTDVTTAVDVGGANGSLLYLLQQDNPALRGIVFDRPNIAADAEAEIARSGFADRTRAVGGDFFESVPRGDLYLLKFILHDWDDESCVTILRRCREAMEPGGRIALIELVVGEHTDPGVSALMDLNMLACTGGRERSLAEYDSLLAQAGLRRAAVLTQDSPQSVIEAVAA
jgi:O-methyltransferase/methyltransferase family protein